MTPALRRALALAALLVAVVGVGATLGTRGGTGDEATPPPTPVVGAPGPLADESALATGPGPPPDRPALGREPPTTEPDPPAADEPAPGSYQALFAPGVEAVVATSVVAEGSVPAWAEPPDGAEPGPPAWSVPVPNEFGGPAHLRVLDQQGDWLHVELPLRPHGTLGWVRAEEVTLAVVHHRVEVSLGERALRVFHGDEVVLDAPVAVGRPDAPTPTGRFYLRDSFAWDPRSVYGPYVLPLSAYSETIDVINGGDAVIAIHGTNRPEALGRAASLGCIRLRNDVVTELAHLIHPGTPVDIAP
jgi:lipoprotein-anchoring transpeptidase ErfK/SrfK